MNRPANQSGAGAVIVLIVEDEPLQRMALHDALEEGGFEVEEAWDADTAVAILERRGDIRLVITDIEMPGAIDGLKLAAAVRDRWPPIEIILVSAGEQPSREDLPERASFIAKPIITERLLAKARLMARCADPEASHLPHGDRSTGSPS